VFLQLRKTPAMFAQQNKFNFATQENTFMADDLIIEESKELKPKPGADH